jgi:pimeloyl-ACP methyl ester carboxylesterase
VAGAAGDAPVRHVDAGGVRTAYTEHGPAGGDAVVLLHGGLVGGSTWDRQLPALVQRWRVLVPDRRGHGRTPDVDGPFTYEAMAADTAAFLAAVGIDGPVHLVGWSDGANVALQLAFDRPELVRSAVAIGVNVRPEGLHPAFVATMEEDLAGPEGEALGARYATESPDGREHWPVVVAKTIAMWRTGPSLSWADCARITCPVLVLAGDDDCITYEHTTGLFEALPHGQLAVVPGTSHLVQREKPALVNELVTTFLDDPTPRRRLPLRHPPTAAGPAPVASRP